ncbi:MAG: transcription factor FapR [Syntrophothermus sp.]
MSKETRQQKLRNQLETDPFLTDEDLARLFKVSVQTIRLDRLELGLPELRERTKQVAARVYGQVRSLSGDEVYGDLIDVQLGRSGLSIMDTEENMGFARTRIVRGHHIFAQANSLAVAIIDAPTALTGSAEIRFLRPVKVGERIVAKAQVVESVRNRFRVQVESRVEQEEIFHGDFVVFALEDGHQAGKKDL